jgi:hypothetical protein
MTRSRAMREAISFAQIRDSAIGSRRTEAPALPATKDSRQNPGVITSYLRRALGASNRHPAQAQKARRCYIDVQRGSTQDRGLGVFRGHR